MKKYLLVDIETTGSIARPLMYDLGLMVIDLKGNIYETKSYVNVDVFSRNDLMWNALYYNKVPQYLNRIANKETELKSFNTIKSEVLNLMKIHNINTVMAYNASFDIRGLNYTSQFFTNEPFFNDNIKVECIMHMSAQVIFTKTSYIKQALINKWLTDKGNIKTSAEMAYRYITNQVGFIEDHTGLEDVKIELQILLNCLKQKKKMNRNPNGNAWSIPNRKYKMMKENGRI